MLHSRLSRRRMLRAAAGVAATTAFLPVLGGARPVRRASAAQSLTDIPLLEGRAIAVGIANAGAITAVGFFLPGGPLRDRADFAAFTEPGRLLAPNRLLVASTSNFGAPLAVPEMAPGSFLSIDPSGNETLMVPETSAADPAGASAVDGRIQLYSANSALFLNSVHNAEAVTAAHPGVSNPLGISLNNAFGRPWPVNAPFGLRGPGTVTVLDPSGAPLAGAPSKLAGGVFAGNDTARRPEQLVPGGIMTGAVGTALLGRSPDDSGRAVFAAACADGSVVQVHVEKGVDGLFPARTFTPLAGVALPGPGPDSRAGVVLNFEPLRTLYVTDLLQKRIAVLNLEDDGQVFHPGSVSFIESPLFGGPVDLAPAKPETEDTDWASNTTLEQDSDLYVADRGTNTVIRIRQDGSLVAARRVALNGAPLDGAFLNGIATAPDGRTIWVTVTGPISGSEGRDGAVIELPAFGA
jgi:hypothetical protein